ncbi:aromatic-ring-hydroxylating dioxygenase subunit beta [Rhodococcus artemisiae]|uniref:Aromatic-ring-hydroxylating dioxygenase subunit beta n=1 Tax=Rhodococcus artemisiae TaxID=714159 RepID=A0ABU7LFV1_9NOCA|nr:aromatic-ring-hydroxylating dioxygenase subunit beta [Rhodococcus artemisiae]MEE2060413.1 aromatic-ring-hydroxylating dioxygenase subunit beta [Rhodococcus artemisiae]
MSAIDFINDEAMLLDDRRYDDWAGLFTEDCRYWAPYDWYASEPRGSLNVIYDDLNRLQDRVSRLTGGDLHSQDPPSKTARILGHATRIKDAEWNPTGAFDEVWATSFRLSELRREQITEYSGRYTYWLRGSGDDWSIVAKKVQLLGAERPLSNLTFPL